MNKNIVFSHIRKNSIKHMFTVALPLALVILLYFVLPFREIFNMKIVSNAQAALREYEKGTTFVIVKPEVIYYSGYDLMEGDKCKGAYYYELSSDGKCVFYLLSEYTTMTEKNYKYSGKLMKFEKTDGLFDNMLGFLSTDLNWTYDDLKNMTSDVVLVDAENHIIMYYIGYGILVTLFAYFAILFVMNGIYTISPIFHPAVRKIKKFKNYESYSKLSDDLDYQVVTEVAAAGGMYITENYFIHLGKFYVNIVPLSEIVFVYKNSQIRDMHILYFKIKYNVHIKGNRKFRCACPGKNKEDADLILDYFAENYPHIINGYTDKNRKLAIKKIKELKMSNKKIKNSKNT